jgi:hypothetical protein
VGNILKQHGIEPAPDRKRQTSWATFLKAHWDALGAIDFTTVEICERNHQGLGNEIIDPADEVGAVAGKIEYREWFVGVLIIATLREAGL